MGRAIGPEGQRKVTASWAEAEVEATLDYGNIDTELKTRLTQSVALATRACQRHFDQLERHAARQAAQTARQYETAFRKMRTDAGKAATQIRAALRDFTATVTISVDDAAALAALRALQTQLTANPLQLRVHLDTDAAVTAVRVAHARMQTQLTANPLQLRVHVDQSAPVSVDDAAALAEVRRAHTVMQAWLTANPLQVRVTVDNSLLQQLQGLNAQSGSTSRGVGKLGGSLMSAMQTATKFAAIAGAGTVAIGSMVPVAAALGAALASVGVAAAAAGVSLVAVGAMGIGTLKTGLSGVGDAFKAMGSSAASGGASATQQARQVESAQKSLTRAVREEKDAQKGVGDARKSALRNLQDLNDELDESATSEKDAVLSLKEAQRDLATGNFTDPLERERAELRVEEAEKRIQKVRKQGARLQEDANEANRKGVNGSDEVVAAQQRLEDSTNAVKEARQALNDAMQSSSGGKDPVAEALAKLSPNARAFVLAVRDMKPAWDSLKNSVQDRLFAGLTPEVQSMGSKYLPLLRSAMVSTAAGFNEGARSASGFLNSAKGVSSVKSILGDTSAMTSTLGKSLGNLVPGLLAIVQGAVSAFRPFTTGAEGGAKALSDLLVKAQESGKITAFFAQGIATAQKFGQVLGSVGDVLAGVFRAASAAGGGNPLANIQATLGQVSSWVNSMAGQNALTTFFTSAREAMSAILPVFLNVAQVIGSEVAPIIADLAQRLGPVLVPAVQAIGEGIRQTAPQITWLGDALGDVIRWVTPLLPLLVRMAPTIMGLVVAYRAARAAAAAYSATQAFLNKDSVQSIITIAKMSWLYAKTVIVQKAQVLATKAVAAAQWLWNAAMSANPIGLIVIAVAGLVAALWAFFTKTETGRKLWDQIWSGIKSAVSGVWSWMKDTVWPWLQSAFRLIGDAAMWLWHNAIQPAWNGIKVAIGVAWSIIKGYFTVWMTVVKAVAAVAMWLWQNVLSPAFRGIGSVISWAWNSLIKPIFDGWVLIFKNVVGPIVGWLWNSVIKPAFAGIGNVISGAWNNVIKPIWDAFKSGLEVVGDAAMWLWQKVIVPAWDGIKSAIKSVWDFVSPLFTKMGTGFSKLGDIASSIGTGLKKAFDGIVDVLKAPIHMVGKLLAGLPDKIGIGSFSVSIPGVSTLRNWGETLKGLRDGGLVRGKARRRRDGMISGRGSATDDMIVGLVNGIPKIRVSNKEMVMNGKAVRANYPALAAMNAGWKMKKLPGLAGGGTVNGREPYGLPLGTNTGGYGSSGSIFPQWVHDIEKRFGVKASTYPGHQEKDGKNKGIDWSGSVANMQRFAEYLLSIKGELEQVIWMNPNTGEKIGVADGQQVGPGTSQPGYYSADWAAHDNHVHTRQSYSFGGTPSGTAPGIDSTGSSGTGTGTGGSSLIGSGIGSGSTGSGSGSSASWGNSGGGSQYNSAADAKRGGITPVWVENWPASFGGATAGSPTGAPTTTTTGGGIPQAPNTVDVPTLTATSSKADVAKAIIAQGRKRGYSDEQINAILATALQESGLNPRADGGDQGIGGALGIFQQGNSYGARDDRFDPNKAIDAFYSRLDSNKGRQGDIWEKIVGVQQHGGPYMGTGGDHKYMGEIKTQEGAARKYMDANKAAPTPTPGPTTPTPTTPTPTPTPGAPTTTTGGTPTAVKDSAELVAARDRQTTATTALTAAETKLNQAIAAGASKDSIKALRADVTKLRAEKKLAEGAVKAAYAKQTQNPAPSPTPTPTPIRPVPAGDIKTGGFTEFAGSVATQHLGSGIDTLLAQNPHLLGKYDNSKAKASIGSRVNSVAESAITGQLAGAFDLFGIQNTPTILSAFDTYRQDNAATGKKENLTDLVTDLAKQAWEAGNIIVNIHGNADGQKVATTIDRERKRKMRRYVTT